MRRIPIFLLILSILLQVVNAETKIFSGKVITDTDKLIEGNTFRFSYDENSNKIFVQTQTSALIIDNGACKSNNAFKVCINSANFSYKNITTYINYYEIDTIIYKLTGSLLTTSKANPNTLLQGESAEFTVTITNPTDFDITNINYNEDLEPFIVKEVKGCGLDENTIRWQGSLQSNYDKICTATIIAEKEGSHNLAGNLSYFNGFDTEKKSTDKVTINVLPKQLKVNRIIDKDIELKQPFYLNQSLENIHGSEEIDAYLTIEIPSNILILKYPSEFDGDFNILKRKLTLKSGSILNYSLYLEASSESNKPIIETFDYTIKETRDVIENYTFVNALEPKPIINFSSEYTELTPNQKFIIIIKLKNPSKISDLTDIKARLNAPYNNVIEQNLNKLVPNESYPIISNTLLVPQDTSLISDSKFKLDLNIEYKFLEIAKSLNKSFELKIKQSVIDNTTKSAVAKTETQISQEIKPKEPITEYEYENKTAKKVIPVIKDIKKIKWPKLDLSDKRIWYLIAWIFLVIIVIPILIYRIKKYKINKMKKNNVQLEKDALKELQEKILK